MFVTIIPLIQRDKKNSIRWKLCHYLPSKPLSFHSFTWKLKGLCRSLWVNRAGDMNMKELCLLCSLEDIFVNWLRRGVCVCGWVYSQQFAEIGQQEMSPEVIKHTHINSPGLLVADPARWQGLFISLWPQETHAPHPGWYYIKQTQVISLTPDITATFPAKSNTPQDDVLRIFHDFDFLLTR